MTHRCGGLCAAYRILGFESATYGDNVFRDLVLARIIEPPSKVDAERVRTEVGVESACYATLSAGCRSTPRCGGGNRWPRLARATRHLGPDWCSST